MQKQKENIIKDVNQALAKTVIYKNANKDYCGYITSFQVKSANKPIKGNIISASGLRKSGKYTTTTVSVLAVKGFLYRMALSAI